LFDNIQYQPLKRSIHGEINYFLDSLRTNTVKASILVGFLFFMVIQQACIIWSLWFFVTPAWVFCLRNRRNKVFSYQLEGKLTVVVVNTKPTVAGW